MIFGHEGLPRSGKSYEAVLHHILPALRAKRHVYVRLNGVGESLDKIAAHLGMPEEEVRDHAASSSLSGELAGRQEPSQSPSH